MRSKRILGVVSAIMMLGVCAVPAYADSEAEIPEYDADNEYPYNRYFSTVLVV